MKMVVFKKPLNNIGGYNIGIKKSGRNANYFTVNSMFPVNK